MKSIWKYKLSQYSKLAIQMPKNTNIICTQYFQGDICLWAEVDVPNDTEELETRYFAIYGTGWEMDLDNSKYIGTVFENNLVWHVYEEKK